MICTNCNTSNPEENMNCFVCGEPLRMVDMSRRVKSIDLGPSGPIAATPVSYQSYDAMQKKKKAGVIIAFVVALAAIASALFLVYRTGLFANKDGQYHMVQTEQFMDYVFGIYDESMSAYLSDSQKALMKTYLKKAEYDIYIEIKDDKYEVIATMELMGQSETQTLRSGTVKFGYKKVTFKGDNGIDWEGTYNHLTKTITLSVEEDQRDALKLDNCDFKKK